MYVLIRDNKFLAPISFPSILTEDLGAALCYKNKEDFNNVKLPTDKIVDIFGEEEDGRQT